MIACSADTVTGMTALLWVSHLMAACSLTTQQLTEIGTVALVHEVCARHTNETLAFAGAVMRAVALLLAAFVTRAGSCVAQQVARVATAVELSAAVRDGIPYIVITDHFGLGPTVKLETSTIKAIMVRSCCSFMLSHCAVCTSVVATRTHVTRVVASKKSPNRRWYTVSPVSVIATRSDG